MLLSRPLKTAVLAFALLAGACDRQSGTEPQPQPSVASSKPTGSADRSRKGSELPDLALSDADGNTLRLRSLAGKPVLVNLWATWCAPCVTELPTLNAIANRADMNLAVVTISQDSGAPGKVREFLDQRGLAQLPAWLDPDNDLSFHYGVGTLPLTVLYDAKGREVWRFAGGQEWDSADAAKLLAEASAAP